MTIIEKKSLRKRKAILSLVEKGEYSVGYALMLVEELSDSGKLTDNDYEYLAEYLESILNKLEETDTNVGEQESSEQTAENNAEEEVELSNQDQIDEEKAEEVIENEE